MARLHGRMHGFHAAAAAASLLLLAMAPAIAEDADDGPAFIPTLVNSSTIPSNGDLNPYGVAFVPHGFPSGGMLATGDVLVSNFNSVKNIQGTGTTIVKLTPTGALAPPGAATTFFTSALPGLATGLGVLRSGFVIVGNVPTTDGTYSTIGQGALQIIDRYGHLVAKLTDPVYLDGPWDLALDDDGPRVHVFVSNVLNGTVSRLDLEVTATSVHVHKMTTIGNGYTHVPNSAAVVLGPTGLAYDERTDSLYVASTADNAIYSIPHASGRSLAVYRGRLAVSDPHLRGPLGLRLAPNGNLLTANGDAVNADPLHPSEIVEFTTAGDFVREYNVDASQGGAFGLDTLRRGRAGRFNYAVVNDVTNVLSVYALPVH